MNHETVLGAYRNVDSMRSIGFPLPNAAGFDRKPSGFIDFRWRFTKFRFHNPSNFKFYSPFLRNKNLIHGLWILGLSCRSNSALKYAKISKFESIPVSQFFNDRIQECLNYLFDQNAFVSTLVGDAVDEFLLGDGRHSILTRTNQTVISIEGIGVNALRSISRFRLIRKGREPPTTTPIASRTRIRNERK